MKVHELVRERRDEIIKIARRHGAKHVRVFGSAAREDGDEDSDIDLLIDVEDQTSPWFPAGLVEDLERSLGRPVDVVTENSLHWLLKRRILREAKPL